MGFSVTIYELDQEAHDRVVGTLSLVGGKVVADPPGDRLLKSILRTPILAPEPVSAEEDPKAFLLGLHVMYRSAYLRASEAK